MALEEFAENGAWYWDARINWIRVLLCSMHRLANMRAVIPSNLRFADRQAYAATDYPLMFRSRYRLQQMLMCALSNQNLVILVKSADMLACWYVGKRWRRPDKFWKCHCSQLLIVICLMSYVLCLTSYVLRLSEFSHISLSALQIGY
jgi:hypothetical protein